MPQTPAGAFFHTPGPKEIYVGFRSGPATFPAAHYYLGTCVTAPDIYETPKFIDVYNDYGGRSIPTQLIWDGSESRLAATINLIDLNVAKVVRDQPQRNGDTGFVGVESNQDRGSLVLGVSDFELVFRNVYFGTVNAAPGMISGRRYLAVVLENYEEHTTGTRVEEATFLFRCNNYPSREQNVSAGSGSAGVPQPVFSQYYEDITGLNLVRNYNPIR